MHSCRSQPQLQRGEVEPDRAKNKGGEGQGNIQQDRRTLDVLHQGLHLQSCRQFSASIEVLPIFEPRGATHSRTGKPWMSCIRVCAYRPAGSS
jgi:hypothetical protein